MTAFTFTDTLSLVITSCAGTSMVTVRNPTLTARSIPGIRMMRPGPRSPTSSPSRNTTRRSYSRTTLIELTTTSRNANPTNSKNGTSNVPMSRLPGRGAHPQRESLDADHHDLGACLHGPLSFRVPHLAVQSDAAARQEPLHDERAPAEHRLGAGHAPAPPPAHREPDHDQEERHRHGGHGEHERPCPVDRPVVEKEQPAHPAGDRAAHRPHA